jgi:hypothetical protein
MFGQKIGNKPESKPLELPCKVGYAWFFEKTVIYGSTQDVRTMLGSRNAKNRHGQFVGVVKALIPVDPYYVLFEYFKSTTAFLNRQKERNFQRRRGITKREMRDRPNLKGEGDNKRIVYERQKKLSKWCRKCRV